MTDSTFGDRLKERCSLRIRRDVVFISSVLFTIALVWLIPSAWSNVLGGSGDTQGFDVWERTALQSFSDVGELTLALVFIGLIVTWTGYLNRVRWTWFVMFILVSGLAFPLGILPLVTRGKVMLHLPELLADAWKGEVFAARGILGGNLDLLAYGDCSILAGEIILFQTDRPCHLITSLIIAASRTWRTPSACTAFSNRRGSPLPKFHASDQQTEKMREYNRRSFG